MLFAYGPATPMCRLSETRASYSTRNISIPQASPWWLVRDLAGDGRRERPQTSEERAREEAHVLHVDDVGPQLAGLVQHDRVAAQTERQPPAAAALARPRLLERRAVGDHLVAVVAQL